VRALRYANRAQADFVAIALYVVAESGSRAVADAFIDQLNDRCLHLASLPGTLGTARPELRPDVRSMAHKDYVIFFRYVEEEVEIVNVVRGQRDLKRLFGN